MKFLWAFLLLFLAGCSVKKEMLLLKTLRQYYTLPQNCAVLLIPNAGCAGCISNAETFATRNIDKYPALYVNMVSVRSKKLLAQKLGNTFLLNPRVKIDTEQTIKELTTMSIYPKIVYIQAGKIINIVESSPKYEKNAWDELRAYLSNLTTK
ncbi:MAG: hypothetical protein EAZ95_00900 [Bacteroidetes bacterium]|nr:MAG: hypothetical protein EAZ95_00900 [Bacteroidota bacterium]